MFDVTLPTFYASLLATILLSFFFAVLLVLAVVTFLDTPRGQKLVRDHLGKRLAGTRMWRMLEHRHVSPLTYVDKSAIPELRAQVSTCEHCSKQEMCDETLGYVGWRHRNYGFCPNRHTIDHFAPSPGRATMH